MSTTSGTGHEVSPHLAHRWSSRDPVRGARVLGVAAVGGAAYALAGAVVAPETLGPRSSALGWLLAYGVLAVALGAVSWATARRRTGPLPLVSLAVLGTGVLALHVVTQDLTFAAQAYLAWPVLYAAHYLRSRATWAVTALACAQVVVLHLSIGDVESLTIDGTTFAVSMAVVAWHGTRVRDANEELLHRLGALAHVDALTGLGSRRAFDAALGAAAAAGAPFAVVLVDLDDFKQVNDGSGHAAGDALLREVSALLRAAQDEDDVAARWGGDELALLVRGGGDPAGRAARTAERFRRAVAEGCLGTPGHPVTVSAGVAAGAPGAGGDVVGDVLARADQVLYAAKRGGRDRVVRDRG